MGGGHDSHGSHGEAAEPIIEVGGTVDKALKVICLFVVMLLAGWGMIMTQPIAAPKHDGEGAPHEKAPNIPATMGGTESGASSHEAPAESHGGEGEVMTGPPGAGQGEVMSGPPATEHH
ncbi:MAG: hypothetical protein K2W95_27510 [Candidatus Obscuribacterales bacterium]|nr:hypothetical protein [Candidatus Obscuribacterales bacterium]